MLKSLHRQAATRILECQHNTPLFVSRFFGVEPDRWQLEAMRAIDAGENVAIRSGHGVGKTALLAWVAIQTVSCFAFAKVPCTAPSLHQLSDLLWAEIAYWLNRSSLKGLLEWTATRLAMKGYEESWFAAARTATKPENLAGFHAPKLRYIADEASGIKDDIMATVDGALTTVGSQFIMAGNPTRTSGYFYDAFHKNRSSWHCLKVSSEDSARVDKSYPALMAAKWGKETDVYRVRVLGEFPRSEADSFISLELVEASMTKWLDAQEPESGIAEIGLDVARYGSNETVFAPRKGYYLYELEGHYGWATTQTAGRAVQLIRQFSARSIKVDDTGVGGGVTDMLCEAQPENCVIVPVNFGGEGDGEHYLNTTGVMWGSVRDLLRSGDLLLPKDDDLAGQLSERKYKINSKGFIVLESKEEMMKRKVPSPDRADAVVLSLHQGDYWEPDDILS